ncbi:MAG: Rne/Rng family ribonuclease [Candidatus Omnitrophica bacterium]|nr:Rne/Rng family ribonuclease [Candidatus Omnitrophota bacterium]
MSKEILIHVAEGERRVAVLVDGKLDDFYIELDRHQSMMGNIYKGRVESILPSINGAFVNIGQEKNGFLYLTDADNPFLGDIEKIEDEPSMGQKLLNVFLPKPASTAPPPLPKAGPVQARAQAKKPANELPLKKDQEILVQVVKDPFGTKGARLTTHISLAGRFVVYMPLDRHHGISKKIDKPQERLRLRGILKSFNFVKGGGFIVRTASIDIGEREIIRDAKFLTAMWDKIRNLAKQKQPPALVFKEYDLIWKVVRDLLKDEVEKLMIDSQEEYVKLRKFAEASAGKEMVAKIHYHHGPQAIFDANGIARELEKIYESKVYLKSGAYVVIEPTEGLIVVDVNSGRFKTKGTPEEAAFAVNMEAAPEIARQLRLRDLGGIIVIDFIDMNREEHKRKVLGALRDALAKDHAKTEVNRISQLGLVEMTRARTGKTIESLKFHACPYCEGRGKVKID